jgi:hypothetical protein
MFDRRHRRYLIELYIRLESYKRSEDAALTQTEVSLHSRGEGRSALKKDCFHSAVVCGVWSVVLLSIDLHKEDNTSVLKRARTRDQYLVVARMRGGVSIPCRALYVSVQL